MISKRMIGVAIVVLLASPALASTVTKLWEQPLGFEEAVSSGPLAVYDDSLLTYSYYAERRDEDNEKLGSQTRGGIRDVWTGQEIWFYETEKREGKDAPRNQVCDTIVTDDRIIVAEKREIPDFGLPDFSRNKIPLVVSAYDRGGSHALIWRNSQRSFETAGCSESPNQLMRRGNVIVAFFAKKKEGVYKLRFYDAPSGEILGSRRIVEEIINGPEGPVEFTGFSGERFYTVNRGGVVDSLIPDLATRRVSRGWRVDPQLGFVNRLLVTEEAIIVFGFERYATDGTWAIALDPLTGQELWRRIVPARGVQYASGVFVVVDLDDIWIYGFDALSGAQIWKSRLPDGFDSPYDVVLQVGGEFVLRYRSPMVEREISLDFLAPGSGKVVRQALVPPSRFYWTDGRLLAIVSGPLAIEQTLRVYSINPD